MSENRKVPVAVLSCFLIAFILQGILKLNGVFVFEKTLDWEIFRLIDNALWLQIIFYSIIMFLVAYCLSFMLSTKFYSTKWYHYVILCIGAVCITTLRLIFTNMSFAIQILLDIIIYVAIPLVICFTTKQSNRMFNLDMFGIVVSIALHIMFYFVYLGLVYWSGVLSSYIFIQPQYYLSSAHFLVELEVYFALISFMISSNVLNAYIKRRNETMMLPVNIASKKAKLQAKKEKLTKEIAKIDEQLAKLD